MILALIVSNVILSIPLFFFALLLADDIYCHIRGGESYWSDFRAFLREQEQEPDRYTARLVGMKRRGVN